MMSHSYFDNSMCVHRCNVPLCWFERTGLVRTKLKQMSDTLNTEKDQKKILFYKQLIYELNSYPEPGNRLRTHLYLP